MGEGDLNYVLSAWLRSYKDHGDLPRRILDDVYYESYEPIVKAIIKRSAVTILCLEDDWDVIVGFACVEGDHTVHYVQVKEAWRRMGLARALISGLNIRSQPCFTHWTRPVDSLYRKLDWIYNPFKI